MKSLVLVIVISMAIIPARAQFFKKLKDETSQRLKEKLDQKKSQKVDEQTEKVSTAIMSVPDSVVRKTGRAFKSKKSDSRKQTENSDSMVVRAMVDSAVAKPLEADSTGRANRQ